ncbi:deoxyuridine triphosphatase [Vespertilionid gammaherpesvirus 1]|uniref:dUTP diphosphatase n=1 Tax=Vespertilionid gammaherpesvirus 1 TaxID=2560830 RepID=A0A0X9X672_9GAMA|nr:deoxyuridine triphosphatase [Myotis gammaherpesvirus 8]AMA67410.1 deoxyuridine triphosphatase [Vespertilionid gammaherpesvirus 1]
MESTTQRLPVFFEFTSTLFEVLSRPENSRIILLNLHPIVVRPYIPTIIPTGIKLTHTIDKQAYILTGETTNKILCHVGMIDSGYRGEIKLIVMNTTKHSVTLLESELKVCIYAFEFVRPLLSNLDLLSSPKYPGDAGYDMYLQNDFTILPHTSATLSIDQMIQTTENCKPFVFGRSGLATEGLILNVTEWSKNPLEITLNNYTNSTMTYKKGTRICQIVFIHNQHFPTIRYFVTHINMNGTLPFYWTDVSFLPVSQASTHQKNMEQCGAETKRMRGECGFGSTGK